MVARQGFEPRQAVPKTAVLPLHHRAVHSTLIIKAAFFFKSSLSPKKNGLSLAKGSPSNNTYKIGRYQLKLMEIIKLIYPRL